MYMKKKRAIFHSQNYLEVSIYVIKTTPVHCAVLIIFLLFPCFTFRLIYNINNANHRPPYLRYAGGSVLMDTALYFSSFPSKISSHSDAFSRVTLVAKFV